MSKLIQQDFNDAYYYQLISIIVKIFQSAMGGKLNKCFFKTEVMRVCQPNIKDQLNEIHRDLEALNLNDDEYDWIFLFKCLNKGIFDMVLKSNFGNY
jgi:hypothetical protein